ncbi:MAG: type IX secretion system membrane protein PorP/SprF [Saprospiraceae bacterium]|nr:type IX secretion system membrane protein PorP/SprF [Saprospiraceae bacterium]
MRTFFILTVVVFLVTFACIPASGQESFYPSEQRVFSGGAFADLNAAYIGRWDQMHVGFERARDWSGFEGNPESGLFYFDNHLANSNSSLGFGFKFDKIAAFKRNEVNLSYAYSIKFLDNGYRPLRLIIGFQPSLDFFRAKYDDIFSDLYPNAVPPEGLDQTTFGLNTGFILTNGGYDEYVENLWYAGLSTRITGISLAENNGVSDLKYQEYVLLSGLRQNLNNEDLYLDATGFATFSLAGIDLGTLLNVEKYNPNHENNMGGWLGVGLKANMQSAAGLKQLVFQAGVISRLFEGKSQLIRIGFSLETDVGPYSLIGNRYGILIAFSN